MVIAADEKSRVVYPIFTHMSRRLYRPPFHRQILPWIFVTVFFATAPVLIFYTSGYRLNTKKATLERTGTLIIDSTPRGAHVTVDEKDVGVTGATLQEIPPGPHTVEVTRDGYYPWVKTLNIRQEQVTFANAIWMVRAEDPQFRFNLPVVALEADSSRNTLAMVSESPSKDQKTDTTSNLSLTLWSDVTNLQTTEPIPSVSSSPPIRLEYAPNGRSLIVGGDTKTASADWFSPQGNTLLHGDLPPGQYFWEGNNLVGIDDTHRFLWNTQSQKLLEEPIVGNLIQSLDPFTLLTPTGTTEIALQYKDQPLTLFSLPSNDWHFAGTHAGYTVLQRLNDWMAVSLTRGNFESKTISGNAPIWSKKDPQQAIVINNSAVSIWDLDHGTKVVWRRSEPVIAADWHRAGNIIFLATERDVIALDLDARDGNIVYQLSSFDHVYDIAVLNQELYIAAEQNGQRGVFVQKVE